MGGLSQGSDDVDRANTRQDVQGMISPHTDSTIREDFHSKAGLEGVIFRCGGAEAVFKESRQSLMLIPGIGAAIANSIVSQDLLSAAEFELRFMEQNDVKPIYFMDDDYPFRLKQCVDAPIMLYVKGDVNLNAKRIVSIVGTRKATGYGRDLTDEIVRGLSHLDDLLIISGLAYGIDIAAHKSCLKYGIPTVGVLAHGLDRIYPPIHYQISNDMQKQGALVSDFTSGTGTDNGTLASNIIRFQVDW